MKIVTSETKASYKKTASIFSNDKQKTTGFPSILQTTNNKRPIASKKEREKKKGE